MESVRQKRSVRLRRWWRNFINKLYYLKHHKIICAFLVGSFCVFGVSQAVGAVSISVEMITAGNDKPSSGGVSNSNPKPIINCDDVYFIFARGSGEELGGSNETAWRQSIDALLRPSSLKYSFYELGSEKWGGFQYPAVSVGGSIGGFARLVGAKVSAGEGNDFGRSVIEGTGELSGYIAHVSTSCPQSKFVLGGYSQGAMVISASIKNLSTQQIIYAATFGDPKLYLPEGEVHYEGIFPQTPDACLGRNLSNYRVFVPNCDTVEGILNGYRPYQPSDYIDRLGTWCNYDDIMCSAGSSLDDHVSYTKGDLYPMAANRIAKKVKKAFPSKTANLDQDRYRPGENLVIAIDRNVKSLLDYVAYQKMAQELGSEAVENGAKVSIYSYGDKNDQLKQGQFTDSATEIFDNINTPSGIERNEETSSCSFLESLQEELKSLNWYRGATKSLVVLTDNSCDLTNERADILGDLVRLSLEIDPVNIYVVSTEENLPDYKGLVELTSGEGFGVGTSDISDIKRSVLKRPSAQLITTSYKGVIGDQFTFDASQSSNFDGSQSGLSYEWDLDFDGVFELSNAEPIISRSYTEAGSGYIQVRVKDTAGSTSTMSARVEVLDGYAERAAITRLSSRPLSAHSAEISFDTNADRVLLVMDEAPIGFLDLQNGRKFTIEDLNTGANVTLVPYDQSGHRGSSQSIVALPFPPSAPDTGKPQDSIMTTLQSDHFWMKAFRITPRL